MGFFKRLTAQHTTSVQTCAPAAVAASSSAQALDKFEGVSGPSQASRAPLGKLTPLPTRLDGFTKPTLGIDAAGRKCVIKRNPQGVAGLIENEAVMQKAYAVFGVRAPRGTLVDTDAGPALVNPFVAGALLRDLDATGYTKAAAILQAHFVVDALLGAWDVIGAVGENIIVDEQGGPWRIDNGCGLDRRARGGIKTAEQFGDSVTELATMRVAPADTNQRCAEVFGSLRDADIAKQIPQVLERRAALLAVLPRRLHKVMGQRLDSLQAWSSRRGG